MTYKDPEKQKQAAKAHYEANKELYKQRAAAHRKKTRNEMLAYIRAAKERPCADCQVQYPYYVMQFDHRPGEIKLFNIGDYASRGHAHARVRTEMAKCAVVCANCHAERTHQRRVAGTGLEPASLAYEASKVTELLHPATSHV